jgi:hypothetical protein
LGECLDEQPNVLSRGTVDRFRADYDEVIERLWAINPLDAIKFGDAVVGSSTVREKRRYILPLDLDNAIQRLNDQELDRLVAAALEERARRKKPPLTEERRQKRAAEAVSVSLPHVP